MPVKVKREDIAIWEVCSNDYNNISLAYSLSHDVKDYEQFFKTTGIELISKRISEFFQDNYVVESSILTYIESSAVAERTSYSTTMKDLIYLRGDWDLDMFCNAYSKVYSGLKEAKLSVYDHNLFFRQPKRVLAYHSTYPQDGEPTKHTDDPCEVYSKKLEDILKKYDQGTTPENLLEQKELISINEGSNEWVAIKNVPILDFKDTNVDDIKERIGLFHQSFHDRVDPVEKRAYRSLLMSIPIIGTSLEPAKGNLIGQGAVFVFIAFPKRCELNKDVLRKFKELSRDISYIFKDIFLTYLYDSAKKIVSDVMRHGVKTAVSAIMSRNMSHNIGSHVLVNLEKLDLGGDGNVENSRGLVYFLKYLRTRMDFLAQTATDWPSWSMPTRFLQDLMHEFLQQQHLLENIAKSEGVFADKLKFQFFINDNAIILDRQTANADIQKYDRWLSIIGGVTGRHAFFIILENIIRNAAKHSYKDRSANLTISLRLTEKNGHFEVDIWDNVSIVEVNNELVDDIKKKVNNSISTDEGQVKKGDWGIAEIKIASAYLRGRSFYKSGFEGELGFNRLLDILNGNYFDKHGKTEKYDQKKENDKAYVDSIFGSLDILTVGREKINGNSFLKYSFKIDKPKEVMILTYTEELSPFHEKSIFVENIPGKFSEKTYDHDFLVVFGPTEKEEQNTILKDMIGEKGATLEKLPTRIFWAGSDEDLEETKKGFPYIDKRIAILDKKEFCKYFEGDKDSFKLWLYAKWIEHLRDKVRGDDQVKDKKFIIYINLTENNANPSNQPYISEYISHNCPALIPGTLGGKDPGGANKNQWESINSMLGKSPIGTVIDRVLVHSEIENNELPVIAFPRHFNGHGTKQDINIDRIPIDRLIYSENLSGSSPHFSLLSSPPESKYEKQKMALLLVEGAILRIGIADERIGKEIGNDLLQNKIVNIKEFVLKGVDVQDEKKVAVNTNGGTSVYITKEPASLSKKKAISINNYQYINISIDAFVVHQGLVDKMIGSGFWKDKGEFMEWLHKLKEYIPFIMVTSGRGRPDEVPDNAKFAPLSDVYQSFFGKHSTKVLLTQTLMQG